MKLQLSSVAKRKGAPFGSRRSEVVNLLRRGVRTVSELAEKSKLTDNAVRSHLVSLEREGLVRRRGVQQGKRRPHSVYYLTGRAERLLAQAYEISLNEVLAAMKRRLDPHILGELLDAAGESLAKRLGNDGGRTIDDRIRSAARLLGTLGGSPRWHRENGKVHLHSTGCPLAAVVVEHPETCLLLEAFLSRLTGIRVRERCQRTPPPRCCFELDLRELPARRKR